LEDASHKAVLAVFTPTDTLDYIDHTVLGGQADFPWVAVDPDGYLYSSTWGQVTTIKKYSVDWNALRENGNLIVEYLGDFQFFDESGNLLVLTYLQGGAFSESGDWLYIVSGYCNEHVNDDGINVFDTHTWRRIRRSRSGEMPFKYEFHPGGVDGEEPEGLTIWNLDDGRAPGVRGSLHVLLLDNDWPDADDVYLKHYTEVIYVDGAYTGTEEGTPDQPFNTIGEAYNLAWDGQRLKIKAGSFPESLSLSKRIEVLTTGGTVAIGEQVVRVLSETW
jgi:hypothetical protein